MILKHREFPLTIEKLEALLLRLPLKHPKIPIIIEDLKKRMAGYRGEEAIDYYLSFLEEKDYYIFHDIRLKGKNHYFQIDTLILTRKIAIIIEVKNISGTIYFDPIFKQLIQTKDQTEKAYQYPLIQLERQESQLKEWLVNNNLKEMKITSIVVISNPSTVIRSSPDDQIIHHKVIRKENLPAKIIQLEKSINSPDIEEKELKKISRKLLKKHTNADFSILARFKINESEILNGVICSSCNYLPLIRVKANWHCPKCNRKDKQAHIQAIKEYKLLVKPTISNAEMRYFLNITSPAIANRLLKSMNLRYTGSNKDRVYQLD
ncbi:nuclease-related domain-containing protein [Metabacillus elymi]|uniref:NERD domain-containing protein n=1 Tax=Metabacillus elymi TaxID=2745198 RepID=A0ABX6S0V6_9BACI|nr:nuclease-related domain-containing protein [Metabacillus sp. KUDC1714]QNF27103.1 NERD domain-containing protein [Metabacillus sp. KUDC1714]